MSTHFPYWPHDLHLRGDVRGPHRVLHDADAQCHLPALRCDGTAGLPVELGHQPDVQQRGEDDGHLFLAGDDREDPVILSAKHQRGSLP